MHGVGARAAPETEDDVELPPIVRSQERLDWVHAALHHIVGPEGQSTVFCVLTKFAVRAADQLRIEINAERERLHGQVSHEQVIDSSSQVA